uniref:RING-type E3 ubiquitin transferase n=1 Tax=Otolemur garnettii TaxID=30611 RepID=H0XR22_OTOGA
MAKILYAYATCRVCMELFTDPVSLPCGHIFCYECIQSCTLKGQSSKLICPLCQELIEKTFTEQWEMRKLSSYLQEHGPLLLYKTHLHPQFQQFREDMSLDAATASFLLAVSEDLRRVERAKSHPDMKEDPRRFTHLACVLGTPSFSTGRHYWEVDVGEVKAWSLGVCKESVDRKQRDLSSEPGFWIISMKAGAISANFIPERRIPASPGLELVVIFLDVEMEEIRFFNKNDALIYIYSPVSSLEPFRPFFLRSDRINGEYYKGYKLFCPYLRAQTVPLVSAPGKCK